MRSDRSFLLPAAGVLLLLSIFPLVFAVAISLSNWNLVVGNPKFIGLDNFGRVLGDQQFLESARTTIFYILAGTVIEYVLGLVLALSVRNVGRGRRFFRVLFLVPMMISPVAVGYIIGRMVLGETVGPVADLLQRFDMQVHWVSNPAIAPWTIVLVDAWQWTPFIFLFLLAGLESLPEEPQEAALVDGASAWQRFRYVTFPMLAPVSVAIVLIRGLELLKLVDIIRVVTGGGPGAATESVTYYVYDLALNRGNMGYGSAVAITLLLMAIILAMIYLSLTRKGLSRWA